MTSSPHAHVALRDALSELDDRRIRRIKPLLPPQLLVEEYPLTLGAAQTVVLARTAADAIVHGTDDRLLVIVGPCSVHDVRAGLEYARLLRAYADRASADLLIIMRVYFEKPRTTVGWKGLINDPNLDGSFAINKGLRLARGLLLELANMGLPAGTEFLDTISPQYTADLIAWGAIGARTTESQVHRELASGLSMPIGFKNGTDGSISVAVDAIKSSSSPHCFLSVTKQGLSAIVETEVSASRGGDFDVRDCMLELQQRGQGCSSEGRAAAASCRAEVQQRAVGQRCSGEDTDRAAAVRVLAEVQSRAGGSRCSSEDTGRAAAARATTS
jgi:3-deoxy-7-phosphoheptulonate synthase